MAIGSRRDTGRPEGLAGLLYRPEVRQIIYQVLLVLALAALGAWIAGNVADNLRRRNLASGFDFLSRTAGFDISQTLIEYANTSSYGRVFWVGLFNTLLVAVLGIVAATVLGFALGIARLSSNWLVARLATLYVEIVRNVPLLLQLFFWYFAVLKNLPGPRDSYKLPGGGFLNVRGLYLPAPVWQPGSETMLAALGLALLLIAGLVLAVRRVQRTTGRRLPLLVPATALLTLPVIAFVAEGLPVSFEYPEFRGFNFQGGIAVLPELIALLLGLSIYTASFIGEIVRAGILGVPAGQKEAALALGLTQRQTLRLVTIPLAMRIIIPPLTSQYLNLTKNSSLAVAIGYPDFVSVFTGTVLNQTGQAVEVILMTMAMFLALSLLTSLLMNWYNRRAGLVEH
jgi:general L-amino acid transport system permease protein